MSVAKICLCVILFLSQNQRTGPGFPPRETLPEQLRELPGGWLRQQWFNVDEEAQLIMEAYELSPDVRDAFMSAYYDQWRNQYEHDQRFYDSVDVNDPPEIAGIKLREWGEFAPVRPFTLTRLIESFMPTGDYAAQRARYYELRQRALNQRWESTEHTARKDTFVREIQRVRAAAKSRQLADGRPVPNHVLRLERGRAEAPSHVRQILQKPETTLDDATVSRTIGVFDRLRAKQTPAIVGINVGEPDGASEAASALNRCESGLEIGPVGFVAAAEDTWYLGVMTLVDRARAGTTTVEQANQIESNLMSVVRRARSFREINCFEYLNLESIESRSEFKSALTALDRPLTALHEELAIRLAAISSTH